MDQDIVGMVEEKYQMLEKILDERSRRLWAAAEARFLPYGGVSVVSKATGLSRTTIHAGIDELEAGEVEPTSSGRKRRPGAGRKPITEQEPEILRELDRLVEPTTRGDPECALRWTCKSTRRLAEELQRRGYQIGDRKVADLLHQMRYSLQANAKTIE